MKLTKSIVDKISATKDRSQAFYHDEQLKGFALSNGVKSFVLEKLINDKVRRITLGRYGELTVEQARKEAQKMLGKIATGIDPIAEKQSDGLLGVTLKETWNDYIKARKSLKPKTLYDYENVMQKAFPDWQNKPLLSITKDKAVKRHTTLGEERGHAYANLSMRLLRALFNFAAGQYEDSKGHSLITENPIKRLSQTQAWYMVVRSTVDDKEINYFLEKRDARVSSLERIALFLQKIWDNSHKSECKQIGGSNFDDGCIRQFFAFIGKMLVYNLCVNFVKENYICNSTSHLVLSYNSQ